MRPGTRVIHRLFNRVIPALSTRDRNEFPWKRGQGGRYHAGRRHLEPPIGMAEGAFSFLRFSWTDCAGTFRSQQAQGEKATRIPPSLGGPPLIHRIAAIHLAMPTGGYALVQFLEFRSIPAILGGCLNLIRRRCERPSLTRTDDASLIRPAIFKTRGNRKREWPRPLRP